jgi:hypothetical protein
MYLITNVRTLNYRELFVKITVCWDGTLSSFGGTCCSHLQGIRHFSNLKIKSAYSSHVAQHGVTPQKAVIFILTVWEPQISVTLLFSRPPCQYLYSQWVRNHKGSPQWHIYTFQPNWLIWFCHLSGDVRKDRYLQLGNRAPNKFLWNARVGVRWQWSFWNFWDGWYC